MAFSAITPIRFGGLSIQRVISENGRSHTTIHVTSPEDPNLQPDELQLVSVSLKKPTGKPAQEWHLYTGSKTDLRLSDPAIAELSNKLNPLTAKRFPQILPGELRRILDALSLEQHPIRVAKHQVHEKDAALPAETARQLAADMLAHAKRVAHSPDSTVEDVWMKTHMDEKSQPDESDPFDFEAGKVFSFRSWFAQKLWASRPAGAQSYLQASMSWFDRK